MEFPNADEILAAYLAETREPAAERLLHTLIVEAASPYVRIVVASILRGPRQAETNDAAQDVLLDLTVRLRRLRQLHAETNETDGEPPIRNFRAYVASAARRAAGFVLRRSNPERYRLRNRLRYALKSGGRFALTEDEQGRYVAGLRRFGAAGQIMPEKALRDMPIPHGAAGMHLADLAEAILDRAGEPVLLTDLSDYIGEALGGFARQETFVAATAVAGANLSEQMDQRAWLAHLWTEIVELPRNQRVSLLLNLRDQSGDSALRTFPAAGIATIRQMAATLEITSEALAAIWRQLPIDDRRIAEMLSLTRQQIVNLRKSARERLRRRMGVCR